MPDVRPSANPVRWKVTFELVDGLPMSAALETGGWFYGRIGASLGKNEAGSFEIVVIVFDMFGLPRHAIIESTRDSIGILLEAIRFRSRLPSVIKNVVAVQLAATGERMTVPSELTLAATGAIATPFDAPVEAKLLGKPRLHAWLRLWNEARASQSDSDSIRNCYMICEDLQSGDATFDASAREFEELKWTRDFVSHGRDLTNPDLLRFVRSRIAPAVTRFDPADERHRSFVRSQRAPAEAFTAKLIEARLA